MKFKDKIYRDLILVLKMCIVIMAFLGVFYTFFYKPVTLEDIKLVEINGNTQSEYILEIDGEYYLYQNDFDTYYAHNSNAEGRIIP